MKKIKSKYIDAAFLCIVCLVVCAIASFFNRLFLILVALSILGYAIIDRRHLRCPHCSGFTNLDRLYYAKTHSYHCSQCGNVLSIEK